MKCVLKIARSSKTNRLYALFDLGYTKVLVEVDDAVKLTGLAYSELQYITIDNPITYEVDIQSLS